MAAGKANRVHAGKRSASPRRVPHYGQTTDFSCGPSSLIMAMKALKPSIRIDRALELQLWREANTIFTGHPADMAAAGPGIGFGRPSPWLRRRGARQHSVPLGARQSEDAPQ